MNTHITDTIGLVLLGIFCLTLAGLYVANIYKLVKSLKIESYSIKVALRGAGVFFPVLGVIMGAV